MCLFFKSLAIGSIRTLNPAVQQALQNKKVRIIHFINNTEITNTACSSKYISDGIYLVFLNLKDKHTIKESTCHKNKTSLQQKFQNENKK